MENIAFAGKRKPKTISTKRLKNSSNCRRTPRVKRERAVLCFRENIRNHRKIADWRTVAPTAGSAAVSSAVGSVEFYVIAEQIRIESSTSSLIMSDGSALSRHTTPKDWRMSLFPNNLARPFSNGMEQASKTMLLPWLYSKISKNIFTAGLVGSMKPFLMLSMIFWECRKELRFKTSRKWNRF